MFIKKQIRLKYIKVSLFKIWVWQVWMPNWKNKPATYFGTKEQTARVQGIAINTCEQRQKNHHMYRIKITLGTREIACSTLLQRRLFNSLFQRVLWSSVLKRSEAESITLNLRNGFQPVHHYHQGVINVLVLCKCLSFAIMCGHRYQTSLPLCWSCCGCRGVWEWADEQAWSKASHARTQLQ